MPPGKLISDDVNQEGRVSDISAVLERLADPDFLDRVVRDPKDALAGYHLSRADISVLADRLADEQEVLGFVEQRVAKAGMFSLLSSALPPDDDIAGSVAESGT